ncbi:MAG: UDP-N-acetylmuramoyl-L-alanine--D-glutamate ligase [Marinilabiliaceae bacterium]
MDKELVILGAGESGTGAALLAARKGLQVFVSDCGSINLSNQQELVDAGIEFESEGHSEDRILKAAEVVKSPGIPDHAPLIRKLIRNNLSVVSEIEFASRYSNARIIGVTGSNGKTTTSLWTYELMKRSKMDVVLAGNVGESLSRQLLQRDPEYFVLELSSFQLDGISNFKCDVAVITNITPDHLDRYDYRFENYVEAKFKILNQHGAHDVFIFNACDKVVNARLKNINYPGQRVPFSFNEVYGDGAFVEGDRIVINILKHHFTFPLRDVALPGKHNLNNAMSSALAALSMGCSEKAVQDGLRNFHAVEHRLESVDEIDEVLYINDSKATNIDSTWFALESMEKPVVWIAGGTDKGNEYHVLEQLVVQKVKALVCLGVDNSKLKGFFDGKVPHIVETRSMKDALKRAAGFAKPGDVVLLSPACASFDLFENYEDRGRQFKKEVKSLKRS